MLGVVLVAKVVWGGRKHSAHASGRGAGRVMGVMGIFQGDMMILPHRKWNLLATPESPVLTTSALGFIQLFFTRALLNYLPEETNMYAMYCRDLLKRNNALNWQGCSVGDIAHYLGLSMLMGIIRLPNLKLYWSNENLFKFPKFTNVMTSACYQELSRFVHAFNKLAVPADNKDKLILVCPVMEYLQVLCKQHYLPDQELSLDEGIMPYKRRLSIKIYSPQKPDKYGVKFYFLCEAKSGYVCSFSVYRGVSQTLKEIVYDLLSGLFGQGYHVYMGNYYNSVNLACDLYDDKVHCTGTLRLPRGAPPLS